MPFNVPDSRLRGRVRAEKRHGHAKGGNDTWRTYEATREAQTRPSRNKGARATLRTFEATHATKGRKQALPPPKPTESWWIELSREAFAAEIARRRPVEHPVILPDPDPA